MATFSENWGQSLSSACDTLPKSEKEGSRGVVHTTSPIVTGTSVIGLIYSDGVLLAADCLASYGSLARFKDVQRISSIGKSTLMASSGDISDQQFLLSYLREINISERYSSDNHNYHMPPRSYFHLICKRMYEKRTKMDPLWNSHIVAGVDGHSKFLACVDLLGNKFESESIATGMGAHLAQPVLRRVIEEKGGSDNLSFDEAKNALDSALRVLYYRDCRAASKIQYGHISSSGQVQISEPLLIETDWNIAFYN